MNRRHFLKSISQLSFAVLLFSLLPKKLFATETQRIKQRLWNEIKRHPDKRVSNQIRNLDIQLNPDRDKSLYPKGKIPSYILEIRYDRADGKDRVGQCLFDLPQRKQATHEWVHNFLTQMRVDHKSSLVNLTGKKYNEIIF